MFHDFWASVPSCLQSINVLIGDPRVINSTQAESQIAKAKGQPGVWKRSGNISEVLELQTATEVPVANLVGN